MNTFNWIYNNVKTWEASIILSVIETKTMTYFLRQFNVTVKHELTFSVTLYTGLSILFYFRQRIESNNIFCLHSLSCCHRYKHIEISIAMTIMLFSAFCNSDQ